MRVLLELPSSTVLKENQSGHLHVLDLYKKMTYRLFTKYQSLRTFLVPQSVFLVMKNGI